MTVPEKSDELADLLATVEQLRERDFPDLDSGLVGAIIEAQREHAEDRAEARKATEQLINRWVANQPAPTDEEA